MTSRLNDLAQKSWRRARRQSCLRACRSIRCSPCSSSTRLRVREWSSSRWSLYLRHKAPGWIVVPQPIAIADQRDHLPASSRCHRRRTALDREPGHASATFLPSVELASSRPRPATLPLPYSATTSWSGTRCTWPCRHRPSRILRCRRERLEIAIAGVNTFGRFFTTVNACNRPC